MPSNIVKDIVIPKCSGKTMKVGKGQVFRVIAHEGKQVADLTFFEMPRILKSTSPPSTLLY